MKVLMISVAIMIAASTLSSCSRRVVEQAPPPRVEYIPVSPSPNHVWVKGYYYQRHRHYYWRPGHYTIVQRGRYRR